MSNISATSETSFPIVGSEERPSPTSVFERSSEGCFDGTSVTQTETEIQHGAIRHPLHASISKKEEKIKLSEVDGTDIAALLENISFDQRIAARLETCTAYQAALKDASEIFALNPVQEKTQEALEKYQGAAAALKNKDQKKAEYLYRLADELESSSLQLFATTLKKEYALKDSAKNFNETASLDFINALADQVIKDSQETSERVGWEASGIYKQAAHSTIKAILGTIKAHQKKSTGEDYEKDFSESASFYLEAQDTRAAAEASKVPLYFPDELMIKIETNNKLAAQAKEQKNVATARCYKQVAYYITRAADAYSNENFDDGHRLIKASQLAKEAANASMLADEVTLPQYSNIYKTLSANKIQEAEALVKDIPL